MPSSLELRPDPGLPGSYNSIFMKGQKVKPPGVPESVDLTGQVAAITGTSGMGLEAGRQLLALKLSRLIFSARNPDRVQASVSKLQAQFPTATIETWPLEMTSYDSIRSFASRLEKEPRLDIAILNAAIINTAPRIVPATGHDEVIQVNYLSTVALAVLLLPILKSKSPAGRPGRLTVVGSSVALGAKFLNRESDPLLASFDSDETRLPNPFDPMEHYYTSKLLGQFAIVKLAERVDARDVVINVVDPGLVKGTGLHRDMNLIGAAVFAVMKLALGRTVAVGSSTYVDAAVVKGPESHGSFLMSWEISAFAPNIYSPEGKKAMDRLWAETLDELRFMDAASILDSMKSG